MKLGIAEILRLASEKSSRADKAAFLKKHQNTTLCLILRMAFVKEITWNLPKGSPPYKKGPVNGDQQYMLYQQCKKLGKFLNEPYATHPTMQQLKRETLFVQLLESCDPEDAELLIAIKDKTLPYKGITATVVNAAFPGLLEG